MSEAKKHTMKKHRHFYGRNALFLIFDRIPLSGLKKKFVNDESAVTCSHNCKPKSNIFPLNILRVFFTLKRNERSDSKYTIYFERPKYFGGCVFIPIDIGTTISIWGDRI